MLITPSQHEAAIIANFITVPQDIYTPWPHDAACRVDAGLIFPARVIAAI